MKLFIYITIVFKGLSEINAITLFELLDTYVPNVFVRWSGIIIKRAWKDVLPIKMTPNENWSILDKKFGKRYGWTVEQDYKEGIDPNIDFRKACLGILTALNIYKNQTMVKKYRDNTFDNLINGNVTLEIIQIAKHNFNQDKYKINIIFRSRHVYYSIITLYGPDIPDIKVTTIDASSTIPLHEATAKYTPCLQLRIDSVSRSTCKSQHTEAYY